MRDGKFEEIAATKEIILCAGALRSPQLLLLSGIGDRAHLEQHQVYIYIYMYINHSYMIHIKCYLSRRSEIPNMDLPNRLNPVMLPLRSLATQIEIVEF